MNPSELIGFVFVVGLATLAGAAAVLGLGLFVHLQASFGRWLAILTVPVMAAGVAVNSLASGRELKYAFENIEVVALTGSAGGVWMLRGLTVLLVGMSVGAMVARLFSRSAAPVARGQLLVWAFALYYLCNGILNSLFGTVPAFSHNSLYVPVVFVAMYMARDEGIRPLLHAAIWALLLFMLASLASAVLVPALALQPDYRGWIPGLTVRLWGLSSNPNSIGPLALLLLLLLYLQPLERRWLQWAAAAAALAVLVLAQSKTAWAAGVACAALLLWLNHAFDAHGRLRAGAILSCVALCAAGALFVMSIAGGGAIERVMAGQIGSDLSTLTGRMQIWSAAVAAWQENPMFGYGPTAWGPAHRRAIGLPFAFSAHNQFLQSLSVAGALGLVSLLLFLAVLAFGAWRARTWTKGVSLVLCVLVLLRCLTEAPLSANTLFNGDVLTLLLLFRLALVGAQARGVHGVGSRLRPPLA